MGGFVAGQKINDFRAWMAHENLDACIVPHSDRFQSEYLTPDTERLAWLTGFTGSAGMAVIAANKAALFTDGRYTLQASQQLDLAVFEVIEAPPAKPTEWLKNNLREKARIGFDPLLFTVSQMNLWQRGAQENDWELIAVEANPVDALWTDRPVQDNIPAEAHSLEYAGMTTGEKIAQILAQKNPKAGHVLISDPSLVCWLLNMRGRDVAHTPLVQSMALLDNESHVTLFADARKIPENLRLGWGNHVSVEDLSHLNESLGKLDKPLQIDPAQCAYAIKEFCLQNDLMLIEATDPAMLLRACKNEAEIRGAIIAHENDAVAFRNFLDWYYARDFAAGIITELDIVEKLRRFRAENSAYVDDSFDTIAGFGPNGAIVHYRANETSNLRLVPNNLLLLDSGGQYRMGTTDVTRVLPVGNPAPQMKKHYTAVLKGLIALSTARFPHGTTGVQLDALARAPVWELGLDYAHGTGHGVGSFLSVHEGPQGISSRNTTPLQPGMILSIEPGIYLENEYGIRLENLVVVIEDNRADDIKPMLAFQTLTKIPFDAGLIKWDALSDSEKIFLQGFATSEI